MGGGYFCAFIKADSCLSGCQHLWMHIFLGWQRINWLDATSGSLFQPWLGSHGGPQTDINNLVSHCLYQPPSSAIRMRQYLCIFERHCQQRHYNRVSSQGEAIGWVFSPSLCFCSVSGQRASLSPGPSLHHMRSQFSLPLRGSTLIKIGNILGGSMMVRIRCFTCLHHLM